MALETYFWPLVIVGTSIWVFWDAKKLGVEKGQIQGLGDLGPKGWLASCLGLWIVAFPLYLAKREELKRVNGKQ